jgi:hypothetical protein
MARWQVWLKYIGQAVVANGFKALVNCIPFGEALYDIAADFRERLAVVNTTARLHFFVAPLSPERA